MNSHKTAITRNGPSAPARWLQQNVELPNPMLDFGCGKGADADYFICDRYDPYYFPKFPQRDYKTIICIYVLNTLPQSEHSAVFMDVYNLLLPYGSAYFAVRNDKVNLNGYTKNGTYQAEVNLNLPLIVKNSGFKIYRMDK